MSKSTNISVNINQYVDPDKSFVINFGSKRLTPIRIKLPEPPPVEYITGYGLPREEQYFKRLEVPDKIKRLEKEVKDYFRERDKNARTKITSVNEIVMFWDLLEKRGKRYEEEIGWMKRFRWHMHHGYWFFNDGKPTYISGWNFSYLHLHWMTLRKGEGYPEYNDRMRIRFLFRKYLYETTETFADLDDKGRAIKVNGKYRMKEIGKRVFLGPIEPKGRREGLTNEFCHCITRIMSETFGADNLGTIVSMDGNNAQKHFKNKLVPAFKRWHIWTQPVWNGGITSIDFEPIKSSENAVKRYLGCHLNYTDSGADMANDGFKIMGAGFDEQGKGKRSGDVGNRWQINKETMTLEAGADILGYCFHPSTVEKMEEGGQDYKEMCEMSDFYVRNADGQTISGLSISYMPSSYAMRGSTDKFGLPVLLRPTERQKELGFKKELGSQTWIARKRAMLYDEKDAKKMDEYRSFVRKFPEDYDDCWKGVAGYIGFPIETIENRCLDLENKPEHTRGRLEYINGNRRGTVEFVHDDSGPWYVAKIPKKGEANLKTTMEYYSAMEDDMIPMFRPLFPNKGIVGVDPHEFNNQRESAMLKNKSRLSDTGIVVFSKRDPKIDTDENDKKIWKTRRAIAYYEGRIPVNEMVAEEALKAAIFWGYLIHLERNKTEVLSHIINWRYGGYLNHKAEVLPDGSIQVDPRPGTHMGGVSKKRIFTLMKDQLVNHVHVESIPLLLKQAMEISSMEELTKYDGLAAYGAAIEGAESIYADVMEYYGNEEDVTCLGIEGKLV